MTDVEIVLDTNIVSYVMKGGQLAKAYAPYIHGQLLAGVGDG